MLSLCHTSAFGRRMYIWYINKKRERLAIGRGFVSLWEDRGSNTTEMWHCGKQITEASLAFIFNFMESKISLVRFWGTKTSVTHFVALHHVVLTGVGVGSQFQPLFYCWHYAKKTLCLCYRCSLLIVRTDQTEKRNSIPMCALSDSVG